MVILSLHSLLETSQICQILGSPVLRDLGGLSKIGHFITTLLTRNVTNLSHPEDLPFREIREARQKYVTFWSCLGAVWSCLGAVWKLSGSCSLELSVILCHLLSFSFSVIFCRFLSFPVIFCHFLSSSVISVIFCQFALIHIAVRFLCRDNSVHSPPPPPDTHPPTPTLRPPPLSFKFGNSMMAR